MILIMQGSQLRKKQVELEEITEDDIVERVKEDLEPMRDTLTKEIYKNPETIEKIFTFSSLFVVDRWQQR